ncbi:MAG: RING finger protein, partial [Candidatus Angelobacter sp.]
MTEPVCPYCRMPFDEASPPRIFCTACGMPHHEDCYRENGGCTVFGCKCAPADDPKLQVSQS